MNARTMERIRSERELKVAMCMKTFFNLNGKQPDVKEMVSWLGEDFLLDIVRYQHTVPQTGAVCA